MIWYNEVMPKRLILALSLLAAVVLLLMLNFATPAEVGPLGVLVIFTSCYVLVLGLALALVRLFFKLTGKQFGRKGYMYGAIIAFGPIMLLLAQSLGSINLVTVSLVVLFVLLACFLVSKRG